MKLYLVRHGETTQNKDHIIQGHSLGDLSEEGFRQANLIGKRLADEEFTKAYVSDLKRTRDTALGITKHHPHLEVEHTLTLRERHFGIHEGQHYTEFKKARLAAGKDYFEYDPEGGEAIADFKARTQKAYSDIVNQHADGNVLVVTHGGFLAFLFLHLLGKEYKQDNYPEVKHFNAALSVVGVDDEKNHTIEMLGDTEHLGDFVSNDPKSW